MGKIVKMSFEEKWANGLKIYDSEKKWAPGAGLPQPRGNIHMYHHKIERSISETGRPIKAKFDMKHLYKGQPMCT